MARFVFVVGRPCTGKSLATRILTDELRLRGFEGEIAVMHDFPVLWVLVQKDPSFRRHRPTEDGGFEITDDSIWQELDNWLHAKLETERADLVIAEVARHVYAPLFDCLPKRIIDQSLVLYLSSSWDIAWQRNLTRGQVDRARYISRVDMEKWYGDDDLDALRARGDLSLTVIENEGTRDELRRDLMPMVDKILASLEESPGEHGSETARF